MSDPPTHTTFEAPEISVLAPLFPGYEIECLIATGGMGAVYRAIQKSLDRTVAIKILPHEFSNDAAFCAGFEAEAKAMARLNHPNLIGVYDFGEVNGMLYIIMEFVPGKSVFHSAHGIAIDPKEVVRLVTGICSGLSHAHENGILHRDIKPSNILLDLNAQPKIGDFGLARPIGTKVQEGEEIFGTPHYTAPEVVDSPHSVGYRADIFSVGVMLHELLTGKLPAEDKRPASSISRCDLRFDAIIRRATNPLPDLRYTSAKEMSNDLQAITLASGPKITAPRNPAGKGPPRPASAPVRPTSYPSPRRSSQSSSSSSGIIMLILAILVLISAYIYYSGNKPKPPVTAPVIPETPIETKSPEPPPPRRSIDVLVPDTSSTSKNETNFSMRSDEPADSGNALAPDTNSTSSQKPNYDVDGFFAKARKAMKDRANPAITTRNQSLSHNLANFARGIKVLARGIDSVKLREKFDISFEHYIKNCKSNGSHIPTEPLEDTDAGYEVEDFADFESLRDEFLAKEATIENTLNQSLAQLAASYILGLEKQIERLKSENDPAAIELIKEEIDLTRSDTSHFPGLMGIKPAETKEENDSDLETEP
jgi:serine/threonine protein kinase